MVGGTTEHALINEHPVNIFDSSGGLIEDIQFTPGLPIARTDVESAFFAQDQWVFGPRVSLNIGLRADQQEVTETFRLGPRAGLVITPFANGRTIIRAGSGVFYDRVPLNVYGFALYPDQIITTYNPDGTILSGPFRFFNLTEPAGTPPFTSHLPQERRGGRLRALQHQLEYPGRADPFSPSSPARKLYAQPFRGADCACAPKSPIPPTRSC